MFAQLLREMVSEILLFLFSPFLFIFLHCHSAALIQCKILFEEVLDTAFHNNHCTAELGLYCLYSRKINWAKVSSVQQ